MASTQDFSHGILQSGSGGQSLGARGGDIGSHNTAINNYYPTASHVVFSVDGSVADNSATDHPALGDSHAFKQLRQAVSPSAYHNPGSHDPPKCHPKTRIKVLEKIDSWIDSTEDSKPSVMWMHGGPGVGKTAIAYTMAERLAEKGRLAASFFFSRNDPSRSNLVHFVPSIAYHITLHIPLVAEHVIRAIKRDFLIFDLSLDTQLSALVTRPISEIAQDSRGALLPCVVIIDGLNECHDLKAQINLLSSISKILGREKHLPLLFFIASRREAHLSKEFRLGTISQFYADFSLSEFPASNDIKDFLEDEFESLKKSHPLRTSFPSSWPGKHTISTLVGKASEQFIYASTVVKYVSSVQDRPSEQLEAVLGLRPFQGKNPFADLDALYLHIFSSMEPRVLPTVLDIFALHILGSKENHDMTTTIIEQVLGLSPGDVQIRLYGLESIAEIVECQNSLQIKIHHVSLTSFLLDESRSESLCIARNERSIAFMKLLRAIEPFVLSNPAGYDLPKCHPETRIHLLEEIGDWIDNHKAIKPSIMWMHGGPGTGKTAIAYTIAERLADKRRLAASFFFSRNDPSRSNLTHLVPSIAYHIALHIPQAIEHVVRAIERNPLIFNLSLDAQLSALMVEPLSELLQLVKPARASMDVPEPWLIVIDGLDECQDSQAQIDLLNSISKVLQGKHLPLLFLITSRSETHLLNEFHTGPISEHCFALSLDKFYANGDIKIFLEEQFETLKKSHPLRAYLSPAWPGEDTISTLVEKAHGQFIYVSTVVKYISSQHHRPNERLDIILGLHPSQDGHPFAELDELYHHIFSSVGPAMLSTVIDILALHIVSSEWQIDTLMTEQFLALQPGDVEIHLNDLESITTAQGQDGIKIWHASLTNFLLDQSRSKALYIDCSLRRSAYVMDFFRIIKTPNGASLASNDTFFRFILDSWKQVRVTPELEQEILGISFLDIRSCLKEHKNYYGSRPDFHDFMAKCLSLMNTHRLLHEHIKQEFDKYHRFYLAKYYADAAHTFLVALHGILADREEIPNSSVCFASDRFLLPSVIPPNPDTELVFAPDQDSLPLFPSLTSFDHFAYRLEVKRFLLDPTRSGSLALNGTKYAMAAIHCLRFLCEKGSIRPHTILKFHRCQIRRNRPFFWRKTLKSIAQKTELSLETMILKCGPWPYRYSEEARTSNTRFSLDARRSAMELYLWALEILPRLLHKSSCSLELLAYASRRSFSIQSCDWPRKAKSKARKALTQYVDSTYKRCIVTSITGKIATDFDVWGSPSQQSGGGHDQVPWNVQLASRSL